MSYKETYPFRFFDIVYNKYMLNVGDTFIPFV